MKAKHKSAIFILGISALLLSRVSYESHVQLPEQSSIAQNRLLIEAFTNHAPIEEFRAIVTNNPDLLQDGAWFPGNTLPLEYAAREMLLDECIALTTIHQEIYSAEFLLRLCSRLTNYNTYDPAGPQYTLKILQVLYATTPKDLDLASYQLQFRLATADYFANQSVELLNK